MYDTILYTVQCTLWKSRHDYKRSHHHLSKTNRGEWDDDNDTNWVQ